MLFVLILLSFFDGISGFTKISKENALKKEAEVAYKEGRYTDAITNLKTLVDSLNVTDEKAVLDLGHAYFKNNDMENAAKVYQKATLSTDKNLRSIAAQQLGVLSLKADNDKEKALAFFKESLRANPNNNESRYNYELLKKSKEENKDNKDQKNKDKKDQDNKKDEPSEFAKQLKAKAEQLVALHKYMDAYNLMVEGAKKDQTVNHFQDFIKKTKVVADIYNL